MDLWARYNRSRYADASRKRRIEKIDALLGGILSSGESLRVLDLGCGPGRDSLEPLQDYAHLELSGIDIERENLKISRVRRGRAALMLADAEHLPFPDNSFDVVLSTGVLEHIQPVEKLCRVISEISRVGKMYCIIIPAIGTVIEPHIFPSHILSGIRWQLRAVSKKRPYENLNYYSDDAWLQFEGFKGSQQMRFRYFFFWPLPVYYTNLAIFKTDERS